MTRFNAYILTFLLICLLVPSSLYGDEEDYQMMLALAQRGNAKAQYGLGLMYHEGYGVSQDYMEAVKWYRKAAQQGDASAQFLLGGMYTQGEGVPQDYAEAVKWYRKAAQQGDASAQFLLGGMYTQGEGVPQDYVNAHMWSNLAATQGHKNARKARDIVARLMTASQIAEAQHRAREKFAEIQAQREKKEEKQ